MIGIFGGTFDPIHTGHRGAIDLLRQTLPLTRVHWVLSARPPHKDQVSASVADRFAMLKLGLAGDDNYVADDTEIKRREKSYTIDTVEAFKARFPNTQLCVLIGGDSVHSLHTWRRYDDLMRSVNWVVMHRPGYPLELPRELAPRLVESPADLEMHACGKIWAFKAPHFDVSSTRLRTLLGAPNSDDLTNVEAQWLRHSLAPSVLGYIRTHKLYTAASASTGT